MAVTVTRDRGRKKGEGKGRPALPRPSVAKDSAAFKGSAHQCLILVTGRGGGAGANYAAPLTRGKGLARLAVPSRARGGGVGRRNQHLLLLLLLDAYDDQQTNERELAPCSGHSCVSRLHPIPLCPSSHAMM